MDTPLCPEEAIGLPAVDRDRGALDPGLLALELVEDLGREAMALRPSEVHAEQHLGPVGRFRATGARADRNDGVGLVVFAGEEQRGSHLLVSAGELVVLLLDT